MTHDLKEVFDLPQAQQRALYAILQFRQDTFRTSDVARKIEDFVEGKAAGAVFGALYRNGYLKKLSGGRDKSWRLSDEAIKTRDELRRHIGEVKISWP
ncbi:MAG: hypothetical protein ABIH36_00615 [bacterium]